MARPLGPKCKLCRREGMKLFLKGERCLTEKCAVERRSYPPGARPHQAVGVPAPAPREAEGAPVLRLLERQFRNYYEKAAAVGDHGEAPAHARDAPRQRRLPTRLRRLAPRRASSSATATSR